MSKAQIPSSLEWTKDAIDGYESITLEHQGCPILTIRGLSDMSCIEEDEEQDVVESVCQTAIMVAKSYNHHQELVTRLYNMVNQFDDNFPEGGKSFLALQQAKETLKKLGI